MSWGSSVLVGVLTAVVGAVVAGVIATLAVGWYRISGFEAGSAAFVVGFIVLGIVAGFLIGIAASRVIAGGANPGMLKALGAANGVLLGIAAVVGVSARLLADVPPTTDGEELMLAVEVRWPDGTTTSPATLAGEPYVRLGSVTGSHVQRASSKGPLWTTDARQVDGRWVAPGAVDIFTTRGSFTLDVVLDSATSHGFLIPLSGKPRAADFQWTEWYPHAKPGAPPLPNGFTYRYRVQKRSQPVRVETSGPFTVTTIAAYFFDEQHGAGSRMAAMSEFTIAHAGKPVTIDGAAADSGGPVRYTRADAVSAIGGGGPALLAHFVEPGSNAGGACYLLSDDAGVLKSELVPDCGSPLAGAPLTTDTIVFRNGAERPVARGWFDRRTFANPGLYLVWRSILDTRRLAVRTFDVSDDVSIAVSVPPLSVSPDERSFARFAYAEHSDRNPALLVTDVVANRAYVVRIDRGRMRYPRLEALDPAWVMHHFAWERDANGVDSLVERQSFVPLAYKGELTLSKEYSAYRLEPAREALREAIIAYLVTEWKGERVAVDSFAYERPVTINGQHVNVAYGSSPGYVTISLDRAATDLSLLQTIAQRLDAVLATGTYDALFGHEPQ